MAFQHTPAGEVWKPKGQKCINAPAQVLPELLVPPRPPQCYITCFKGFVAEPGAAPVLTNPLFDFGWSHKRKSSFLPFAQHVLLVNLCILFCFVKRGVIESLNGLSWNEPQSSSCSKGYLPQDWFNRGKLRHIKKMGPAHPSLHKEPHPWLGM